MHSENEEKFLKVKNMVCEILYFPQMAIVVSSIPWALPHNMTLTFFLVEILKECWDLCFFYISLGGLVTMVKVTWDITCKFLIF